MQIDACARARAPAAGAPSWSSAAVGPNHAMNIYPRPTAKLLSARFLRENQTRHSIAPFLLKFQFCQNLAS